MVYGNMESIHNPQKGYLRSRMLIVRIVGNIIRPLMSLTLDDSMDLRRSKTRMDAHAKSKQPNAHGMSQYRGERW